MQNSTLVLTSENRTRDQHEPSGEPETLWGRMKGKMGDRALRERPPAEKERLEKAAAKKKRQTQQAQETDEFGMPSTKVRRTAGSNVLDVDSAAMYRQVLHYGVSGIGQKFCIFSQ
jgi:pre-mRNA-splicing helicase BRR2